MIAFIWLLSLLLAPAPMVSMVVETRQSGPLQIDVTIWLLNSDPRYQDFAVTVTPDAGVVDQPCATCPLHVPATHLQGITRTLTLDIAPSCGPHVFGLTVFASVLTDTLHFSRTDVGGVIHTDCAPRLFFPLVDRP